MVFYNLEVLKLAVASSDVLKVTVVKELSEPDRLMLDKEFPIALIFNPVNALLLPMMLTVTVPSSVHATLGSVKTLLFPVTMKLIVHVPLPVNTPSEKVFPLPESMMLICDWSLGVATPK